MTGMGNLVSQQLLYFLRSIALGASLGLVYDLLGALRGLGGRLWGGTLDALFCLTAAAAVFCFALAGDGELRVFMALGVVGGAALFWRLLGGLLRPVWGFWLGLALLPARFLGRILRKCGRMGKKVFSFCGNWVTMVGKKLRGRRNPPRREGEGDMEGPSGKKKAPRKKRRAAKAARPGGRLAVLLLAVLLVGVGAQIFRMFGQLQSAREEERAYAQRLEELREANRQLQEDLDNSGSLDLIEDIARMQLGMAAPGEKVFYLGK